MMTMSTADTNGYIETELGLVPVDWAVVTLAEATLKTGTRDPRRNPTITFRYIDVSSVSNEIYRITNHNQIVGGDAPSRARKVVFGGDTIFATVRPYLRNIAQVSDDLHDSICSTGFCVIRANKQISDSGYLYYAVLTDDFVGRVVARQKGSSYPAVTDKEIYAQLIPLPPLPEQLRIAAVLNAIQEAIAAQDDVIAAARAVKRSLLQRLFTYGPGQEPAETKETEIGELPAHWEVVQFGDSIATGPQNGLYKSLTLYGSGTPILRINDYENDGSFFTLAFRRVQVAQEEFERYRLYAKDIVINRVNSLSHLGKAALIPELPEPSIFESNMMRLRLDSKKLLPDYAILWLLHPNAREQMRGKAKRAVAQSSINQGDMKSLLIPRPNMVQQQQIAEMMAAIENKIAVEEDRKAALQAFFKSLLHQLMTGQLRLLSDKGLPL